MLFTRSIEKRIVFYCFRMSVSNLHLCIFICIALIGIQLGIAIFYSIKYKLLMVFFLLLFLTTIEIVVGSTFISERIRIKRRFEKMNLNNSLRNRFYYCFQVETSPQCSLYFFSAQFPLSIVYPPIFFYLFSFYQRFEKMASFYSLYYCTKFRDVVSHKALNFVILSIVNRIQWCLKHVQSYTQF